MQSMRSPQVELLCLHKSLLPLGLKKQFAVIINLINHVLPPSQVLLPPFGRRLRQINPAILAKELCHYKRA